MKTLQQITMRVAFVVLMVLSIIALAQAVGIASPWFGVIGSFCLLGLMDLATPFVRIRMPSPLRKVQPWEVRSGAYRIFGVEAFGAFLRKTPARLLNRRVYLRTHDKDFEPVRVHIENAEAAHFWGGLATVPYLSVAWFRGWCAAVVTVVLFDLVVNLYPILHLRSVRGRMERMFATERLSACTDEKPG